MKIIEETEIRYFCPDQNFILKEEIAFRNVSTRIIYVQSVEYHTIIIYYNNTTGFIALSYFHFSLSNLQITKVINSTFLFLNSCAETVGW